MQFELTDSKRKQGQEESWRRLSREREHAEREDARKRADEEWQSQQAQEEAWKQAEDAQRRAEEERQSEQDTASQVPKEARNYGEVLGLTGNITRNDLRKQYLSLAKKYHPDRVDHLGDKLKETAEIEMKKINEAYEYFKGKYGL